MDIEAEVAETKLREVIQGEEWALFHGNTTYTNSNGVSNLAFNGLDVQVVTNIVNNAGAALTGTGNSVNQLDKIIKLSRYQGGTPTHLFCSFGMQIQINQILAASARYFLQDGTTVTGGIQANNYQSTVGVLPVVGDFFVNPATPYPYNTAGSSGPAGGPTSSIYLIQLDEMSMVDLMAVGRTELAKIADTIRFYISEYSVLAVKLLRRAGATLHGKIRYIGEGLNEATQAVVEEIIPREVVYHSMLPRREHTRIAL